eukprot:PhF_6_TR15608/c0_g1_i1/m.24207/K14284/NXF, TAP, MEX67; nuclear RNA export factor
MPRHGGGGRKGGGGGGRGGGGRGGGGGGGHQNKEVSAHSLLVNTLQLIIEKHSLLVQPNIIKLSDLPNVPDLQGVYLDLNTNKTCEAICMCIKRNFPNVDTIVLDCNKIKDPSVMFQAMKKLDMAGDIKAISMSRNPISGYQFINHLKVFPALQELRFSDTPIAQDAGYRRQISKALPNLLLLDGDTVERNELNLPWPVYPGGAPNARNFVIEFTRGYFGRIEDGDIDSLAQTYHPNAVMSITTSPDFNLNAARNTPGAEVKVLNSMQNDITQNRNRNILKASSTSAIIKRASRGMVDIVATLKKCLYHDPVRVSHIIDYDEHLSVIEPNATDREKFLIVKFHGMMEFRTPGNADSPTKRLFDRTWVLVTANNPCQVAITNDLIHLRGYNLAPMWLPQMGDRAQKLTQRYGIPPNISEEVISVSHSDTSCHSIAAIVAETKLRPPFAKQCLDKVGGNPGDALEEFFKVKDGLQPDFFC